MGFKTTQALSSRAIIGKFFMLVEGLAMGAWARKLAHFNDTDQSSEEYLLASMTPAMRRWIGGRDAKRILSQSITVVNDKFETTIVDKRENWQYDKTGQLDVRINDLVKRSETHWNKLASELLILGGSTLCYDGQYFFDTDHSFGLSGTLKNLLTSSEVAALNVATAAILGVINYFYTFKDDQGEPLHEDAEEFVVMVPPNLAAAAGTALNKSVLVGGVDNPLLGTKFRISLQVNPRLSTTTVFYVFRADCSLKPFILQQRGMIRMTAKAEGSDFEHDTDQWEFGASAERAAALFSWETAAKCTLS